MTHDEIKALCDEAERLAVAWSRNGVPRLVTAIRQLQEIIDKSEQLFDGDGIVEHPQPQPRILTLCAAARATMQEFGQQVRDLTAENERLRGLIARAVHDVCKATIGGDS